MLGACTISTVQRHSSHNTVLDVAMSVHLSTAFPDSLCSHAYTPLRPTGTTSITAPQAEGYLHTPTSSTFSCCSNIRCCLVIMCPLDGIAHDFAKSRTALLLQDVP